MRMDRDFSHKSGIVTGADTLAAVAALLSLVWHYAYWLLIVRARYTTGVWPRGPIGYPYEVYYVPTPVNPGYFAIHQVVVWALFCVCALAGAGACAALLMSISAREGAAINKCAVGCLVLGIASIGIVTVGDVGGFWSWYLD